MNGFWWHRLPMAVNRFSPMLAVILADGLYLSAWRAFGAVAPPLALLLGFLLGWSHFPAGNTFTFSIWTMALMLVVSSFGTGLGAWLVVGYAVGDFFLFPHLQQPDWFNLNTWLYVRMPLVLSYALLATLLVSIPLTSRVLRRLTLPGLEEKLSSLPIVHQWIMTIAAAALQAVLQGSLVYIWTQAVPTLIRPLFTWQGSQPPVAAIQPLQANGQTLVWIAAILGFTRIILEYRALEHPEVKRRSTQLQTALTRSLSSQRLVPVWIRLPFKAAFGTFMLSGILAGWQDALIVGSLLFLAMLLREGIFIRIDARWSHSVSRIPLLLRIGVAFGINYFLAIKIVETLWNSTSTFLPIVVSTIVSFVVFALLIPSPKPPEQKGAFVAGEQP